MSELEIDDNQPEPRGCLAWVPDLFGIESSAQRCPYSNHRREALARLVSNQCGHMEEVVHQPRKFVESDAGSLRDAGQGRQPSSAGQDERRAFGQADAYTEAQGGEEFPQPARRGGQGRGRSQQPPEFSGPEKEHKWLHKFVGE